MSFYKIPIYDEHEVNVIELPVPKSFKEKVRIECYIFCFQSKQETFCITFIGFECEPLLLRFKLNLMMMVRSQFRMIDELRICCINFTESLIHSFLLQAYMLLNYPKSSNFATALSVCDCALIFIAVAMLILETEPKVNLQIKIRSVLLNALCYCFNFVSSILNHFAVSNRYNPYYIFSQTSLFQSFSSKTILKLLQIPFTSICLVSTQQSW